MSNKEKNGRVINFPHERARKSQEEKHDYAAPLLKLKQRSTFVRQAMLALPSWVTPNGVTIFRALLVIPAVLLLVSAHFWWATALLTFAMILDFVDGALAEARNAQSEVGAFLDPLADKILICVSLYAVMRLLPWPFVPVTIAICFIAGALTGVRVARMQKANRGLPTPSVAASPAGKLKLVAETVGLMTCLLALAIPAPWMVWVGFTALLVALRYGVSSLLGQIRARAK